MPTLVSNLHRTVEKSPEQIALIFNEVNIEYGRLLEAVKRLAQGLKELGVRKGDRVALMLPNVPHFCISYYAVLEIGAVVVPFDLLYKEEEIKHRMEDCEAGVIIAWVGFYSRLMPSVQGLSKKVTILLLGERIPRNTLSLTQLIARSSPLSAPVEVADGDLAVINYTSGSLDESFGAELSHAALVANASICRDMLRITSEERLIAVLPFFHPLGQTLVMNTGFMLGATIILVPRFVPADVIDAVRNRGVTLLAGVPAMFRSFAALDLKDQPVPCLKYCVSYGGRLTEEVIRDFEQKYDALILEAYGLTEAGPLVTCNRINRDRKIGSVGLPLLGVEVQIRDEEGALLRPNNSGEIWVRSPSTMTGYHNHPEETQKKLRDGWLFTGDIGYLDEDHYLYVQERKDDIIVKGGFHIFPHEVEEVIARHPAVAEVAVIGVPHTSQGFEVKAFVVLKENQSASEAELIACCEETLPKYKTPNYVEICASLPKSATGRILKQKLRAKSIEKEKAVFSSTEAGVKTTTV